MKNSVIAIVLMIMVIGTIFTGCGKSKIGDITVSAGESAIYIKEDGTVSYAICESFEEDYYDKGDLKDIIKEEIDEYNAGPSASELDSAKLESFKEKDDVVTAIIEFKKIKDFVNYIKDYNGEGDDEIFIGDVAAAVEDGLKISGEFTVVEDGNATEETVKGAEVKKSEDKIILLNEQMIVQVDGSVQYISSNCTIKDGIVTVTDDETAYIVYK